MGNDGYAKRDDLTFHAIMLLAEMKTLCQQNEYKLKLRIFQEAMDKSLVTLGNNAPLGHILNRIAPFLMKRSRSGAFELDGLPKRIQDALFTIRQHGNEHLFDKLSKCIPLKPMHCPSLFRINAFSNLGEEGLPNLDNQPAPVELWMIYQDAFYETRGMTDLMYAYFELGLGSDGREVQHVPFDMSEVMAAFDEITPAEPSTTSSVTTDAPPGAREFSFEAAVDGGTSVPGGFGRGVATTSSVASMPAGQFCIGAGGNATNNGKSRSGRRIVKARRSPGTKR